MDGNYVLLTNTSDFGNGGLDMLLSKLDDSGEMIWEKSYGSSSSDQGQSLAERDNGDLVVLGNSNEKSGSESNFEMFLLETDQEGNPK